MGTTSDRRKNKNNKAKAEWWENKKHTQEYSSKSTADGEDH